MGRRGERVSRGEKSEVVSRRSEDRLQMVASTECQQQNKEQQNDEVITSIFDIPCSIFCGSKGRQHK